MNQNTDNIQPPGDDAGVVEAWLDEVLDGETAVEMTVFEGAVAGEAIPEETVVEETVVEETVSKVTVPATVTEVQILEATISDQTVVEVMVPEELPVTETVAIDSADDAVSEEERTESEPAARQSGQAARRAIKESLISQAELVAMMSPPETAPAEMKALLEQWKQAGRISRTEDNALWLRFNRAQDQLFTRLTLLREQRQAAALEAKQQKESLVATAEELASRSDTRQAAETMASLMSQWKQISSTSQDRQLWLRFKAAQDTIFERRTSQRKQSETDQRQAAETKRALIASVEALIGSPDLRQVGAELRKLAESFRQSGYAGRDLNRKLGDQFRQTQQACYEWMRQEPTRRRESGQQETYGRRGRLVQQIEQTKADLRQAEATLRTVDSAGSKRSHGRGITLTLGQLGTYTNTAAETMRLKIKLGDLEKQLTRLDTILAQQPTVETNEDQPAKADAESDEPPTEDVESDQASTEDTTPDQPSEEVIADQQLIEEVALDQPPIEEVSPPDSSEPLEPVDDHPQS